MHISQSFKDALINIGQEKLDTIGISDPLAITNDLLATSFLSATKSRGVGFYGVVGGVCWSDFNVLGIDDEYIRGSNGDYYNWRDIISNLSMNLDSFNPIFQTGQILKGKSRASLKKLGANGGLIDVFAGVFFRCIGYNNATARDTSIKGMLVTVEDIYGSIYTISQNAFIGTKKKSLNELEEKRIKEMIAERIIDRQKLNIEQVNKEYQKALRDFMKQSKLLHEATSVDISEIVDKEYQTTVNFSNIMKSDNNIESAVCIFGKNIEMVTKFLYSENNKDFPIGKFRVKVDLLEDNFRLNIKNLCARQDKPQHPHILPDGGCCLGDFKQHLQKYYKASDFVSFSFTIIEFLLSYFEKSKYVSLVELYNMNRSSFDAAIREEEKKAKEEESKEEIKDTRDSPLFDQEDLGEDKVEESNLPF